MSRHRRGSHRAAGPLEGGDGCGEEPAPDPGRGKPTVVVTGTLPARGVRPGAPSDVHGRHTLPGAGLGAVPLHGVEAAGAVIAAGHVQGPLQHCHSC